MRRGIVVTIRPAGLNFRPEEGNRCRAGSEPVPNRYTYRYMVRFLEILCTGTEPVHVPVHGPVSRDPVYRYGTGSWSGFSVSRVPVRNQYMYLYMIRFLKILCPGTEPVHVPVDGPVSQDPVYRYGTGT